MARTYRGLKKPPLTAGIGRKQAVVLYLCLLGIELILLRQVSESPFGWWLLLIPVALVAGAHAVLAACYQTDEQFFDVIVKCAKVPPFLSKG